MLPFRSLFQALAVSAAVVLGGCAGGIPSTRAVPTGVEPASACAPEGQRLATLTVSAEDLPAAGRSIVIAPGEPMADLELRFAQRITGRCASAIRGSQLDLVALATGEGLAIDAETNIITPSDLATAAVAPDPVTGGHVPILGDAEFIMASYVSSRLFGERLDRNYIGLWRDADIWVIASFRQRGDSPPWPARELMRSALPILAFTYFPSIDTNTGGIHLTQLVDDQTVRIIGYFWDHGEWFDLTSETPPQPSAN